MGRKTGSRGNAGVHRQDLRRILSAERLDKRAADTLPAVIRRDKEQIDMRPDGGDKANRLILYLRRQRVSSTCAQAAICAGV